MPANLSLPPVPPLQDAALRFHLVQTREVILKLLSLVATSTEVDAAIDAIPPTSGGSFEASEVSVAFTDGDTIRRLVVMDADVLSSDRILVTVRRPNTVDSSDRGYIYLANVVSVGSGTFTVLVVALDLTGGDTALLPPNETVTLVYARSTP